MKKKASLVTVLLTFLFYSGCGSFAPQIGPSATKTPSIHMVDSPEPSATSVSDRPIPERTPPFDAGAVDTDRAAELRVLDYQMSLDGSIWISRLDEKQFFAIDLNSKEIREVRPPRYCFSGPPVNAFLMICNNPASTYSIIDLATNEEHILPASGSEWISFTSNGRFVYYAYIEHPSNHETIQAYDLQDKSVATIAEDLDPYQIAGRPVLSPDGEHLMGSVLFPPYGYRVVELSSDPSGYRQVGTWGESTISETLSWSPEGLLLAYGTSDVDSDIAVPPKYIYVLDLERMANRRIATAPPGKSYSFAPPTWSPHGDKVAISLDNSICIVTLETPIQQCHQAASEDDRIANIAWSPDGSHVAFTIGDIPPHGEFDIGVFGLDSLQFATIATGIESLAILFWR